MTTVHLLLSAGRGPEECAWAVAELTGRLEAEAGRLGLRTGRAETVAGEHRGTFRSVLLRIGGDGAAEFAGSWTGTLCWQAPSPYRSGTGRKNWYVIAGPVPDGTTPAGFTESDVAMVAVRTGGPGGQHRNKAGTAVRATHRPTGLVVVVDTERQLSLNRRLALQRLRDRLEQDDHRAVRQQAADRRRVHDELVRGDPIRTERPTVNARRPGR